MSSHAILETLIALRQQAPNAGLLQDETVPVLVATKLYLALKTAKAKQALDLHVSFNTSQMLMKMRIDGNLSDPTVLHTASPGEDINSIEKEAIQHLLGAFGAETYFISKHVKNNFMRGSVHFPDIGTVRLQWSNIPHPQRHSNWRFLEPIPSTPKRPRDKLAKDRPKPHLS